MLADILNSFESVSLPELDKVKLMDRVDTKYIFGAQHLPLYLDALKGHYRVLEVSKHKEINYESVYFDTRKFDLYQQHHRGKTSRYKIRFRRYVESNVVFFEVKFKSNKGRTIKNRIDCPQIEETIVGKAREFMEEKTHLSAEALNSVMSVNYTRITLVDRFSTERVTVDTNLCFKAGDRVKHMNNLVFAEVKQEVRARSEFAFLMKSKYVREGGISKYCLGVASLIEDVRKNNFKQQMIQINKLQQYDATGIE